MYRRFGGSGGLFLFCLLARIGVFFFDNSSGHEGQDLNGYGVAHLSLPN